MSDDEHEARSFAEERIEALVDDGETIVPVSAEELCSAGLDAMDDRARRYVRAVAGAGRTYDRNRSAFERWQIVPRVLRDVDRRDHRIDLLGHTIPAPVFLAPIAAHGLFDDDAEVATARAAASVGLPFMASSLSSVSLEVIAEVETTAPRLFQLYASRDEAITTSFLERAEAAGYDGIVLTVDAPLMGWREVSLAGGAATFDDGEGLANYLTDPAFGRALERIPSEDIDEAVEHFEAVFAHAGLTWTHLEDIVESTTLPVLVKGIVHPDDARLALQHGASGVIVSTHGGRQVDNAISSIEAVPSVVERVGGESVVLLDSGIRRGADAFTALALGVTAVGIGRPYLYGLAIAGARGVEAVLRNLLGDLDMTLALSGHRTWSEVDESALVSAQDSSQAR
ncbi:MAG: alpha-hydroxy-acid oxidizing protein [Halobacteriota archaeon]